MRNFTLAVILALGTQYLTAEPYTKQIQPTQSAATQMNQSSKTMPPDPLDKKMAGIRSRLGAKTNNSIYQRDDKLL